MAAETTPATVKPADSSAASASATATPKATTSTSASASASSTTTTTKTTTNSTSSGSCPTYNEITSDCNGACPNNVLCVKYRSDGQCSSSDDSTCIHPAGDPCAYECIDGTSRDFDQWTFSPYAVPGWATSLHNNKQVEAIRALDVPRNITQLSINFVFNELNLTTIKGKVASIEFPDKRFVTVDSQVSSIALLNLDYRKIPVGTYSSNLQYLLLHNCLLSEVPEPVFELQQLNLLDLASNNISKLPSDISKLPLAAIYMDDNEFTQFPDFLTKMNSLKVAGFATNKIPKFTIVDRSSALNELDLNYNRLKDFAGVIPSLEKLYLRGNQLTTFPSTMSTLTNLKILDVTENTLSSQAIAQTATNLTHAFLSELMMGSNGLHTLPDLGNVFPNLETLWVRNNSIEKVEGTYNGKVKVLRAYANKIKQFTASFSRLVTLDLSDNKLEDVPDVASISPALQTLNVSKNQFEKLKNDKPMTTLTVFNASRNSLSSFSLQLPNLRVLDLSYNKFKEIPAAVWTYSVLDELHIEGNDQLKNVQFTQDQYSFIKRLSKLTMDTSAVRSDCPNAWKTDFKGISICVQNGSGDTSVQSAAGVTHTWTWISIMLGSMAAIALAAFIFVVYRRRSRYNAGGYDLKGMTTGTLKPEDRTAGLTQTFGSLARSYPNGGIWDDEELQERRVDYDSIKFESKLAAGAYGEVWIGTYRMECVAVKKLSDAGMRDKNALAYFVSEIKLLAQLDHPRIIRFYGVAWTSLTDLCAVIEYMPGGDLHSMLRTPLLPQGRWNAAKLQIALDTVEALTYVHTLDDVLIHRDLKSRNVLLDDDWRAKVTDFGISRFQRDGDATMTSGIGTGRWMAPEVVMGRSDYTEKVDVYSFGVILSELDTHQMPYSQTGNGQLPLTEMGILQQVSTGELRPSFSPTCPPQILDIANKCLSFQPDDRPSSLEVAYMLRQLIPLFPREDAPRPSSMFARSTFSMSGTFRKSSGANNWRAGSERISRKNNQMGEFSF